MSLARKHFQRVRAQREAADTPATQTAPAAATSEMPMADRMLALLRGHKAALKNIQSRQRKAEAKREYLPDYDAYIDGVLAADNGGQDTVLVTVMLWRIDAGQYEAATEIAAYAIRHGLAMPEGFRRNLPSTVVEDLADAAGTDPENAELCGALDSILDLVTDIDMPDEVRAKGCKGLGAMIRETDPERTIDLWDAALELDPKCGIKTERDRLRKKIATDAPGNAGT
jgi:hypothetical protein